MEDKYYKQAVIITAYRGFEQLWRLANKLSTVFEVFIHIDKRIPQDEWRKYGLTETEHIKIYSLYKVNWGGCNHLKAILYLMNEIINNKKIAYFHIISGEDWPIRNIEEIYQRFTHEEKVYMYYKKLNCMDKREHRYVCQWQKYYSFLDVFDYKKVSQKIFVKILVLFQKVIGINRLEQLDIELARGTVWGDLPRKAVEYCLDYLHSNPEFMSFLEYGHASEEFFFQTILLTSKEWREKIENRNLRYVIYERRNGSYPAILDLSDVEKIQAEDYIFARKVRFPISSKLINELDKLNGNE